MRLFQNIKYRTFFFLAILFTAISPWLAGCIEEIDPHHMPYEKLLVVEGHLTDQLSVHEIKITWTAPISFPGELFVTDANVRIECHDGSIMQLSYHEEKRVYRSRFSVKGEPGKSYTLVIELPDGRVYRSEAEKMAWVPPIDTIYYEFRTQGYLHERTGMPKEEQFFDIFVDTTDPDSTDNFYLWRNSGIIEIITLYPLMGWVPPDYCILCWQTVEKINNVIYIRDGRSVKGNVMRRQNIATIRNHHLYRYMVIAWQHAITETAYRYWKMIYDQVEDRGGLYDPPPAPPRGNIFLEGNPDERLPGLFMVSSVTRSHIIISRYNYPNPNRMPVLRVDCLSFPNTTDERPEGFYP